MRALFLALAISTVALATSTTVFAAGATQLAVSDRFCIRGEEFGSEDCRFVTYQQCQATASGLLASCGANLAFTNVVPTNRTHSRHH